MTIIWALLLLFGSLLPAHATLTTYTSTIDLDAGAFSYTTTHSITAAYLRQIAVNFSAAPEAAETVTVTATSSAGSNYDRKLSIVNTVAAATTSITFLIGTPIQVDSTHQIKVDVTNASQSVGEVNDDPTVYVSILVDTNTPTGSEGIVVLRDGVLLASTRYNTFLDESVALVQRSRINVTGGGVVCTDNTTQSRTDCTITDQYYSRVQEEGSNLTQRQTLNMIGVGVTCVDNSGSVRTDCTIPGWTYVVLGSDFTTQSITAVDVTAFNFTPAISTKYEIRGQFLLRTTLVTTGARPGVSYPLLLTDAVAAIACTDSATANVLSNGDGMTAHQCLSTGLPTTTSSWPAQLNATLCTGALTTGAFQITLHSETALIDVTMKAGSWIAYRIIS